MRTTVQRMQRFALTHILKCGSATEARRKSEGVLEHRCPHCHRVVDVRVGDDEDIDRILAQYAHADGTA